MIDWNELTEKEYNNMTKFENKHKKHKKETASGGQFTYHITPTGVGSILVIECNACKKTKDLTEYGAW